MVEEKEKKKKKKKADFQAHALGPLRTYAVDWLQGKLRSLHAWIATPYRHWMTAFTPITDMRRTCEYKDSKNRKPEYSMRRALAEINSWTNGPDMSLNSFHAGANCLATSYRAVLKVSRSKYALFRVTVAGWSKFITSWDQLERAFPASLNSLPRQLAATPFHHGCTRGGPTRHRQQASRSGFQYYWQRFARSPPDCTPALNPSDGGHSGSPP